STKPPSSSTTSSPPRGLGSSSDAAPCPRSAHDSPPAPDLRDARRPPRSRRDRRAGLRAEARWHADDRAADRSRIARPALRDDGARRLGLFERARILDRDRREAPAPSEA